MKKLIIGLALSCALSFAQAPQIADTVTLQGTRAAVNTALSSLYSDSARPNATFTVNGVTITLGSANTLTSNQITESGNLYFTNARVLSAMAGLYESPLSFSVGLTRSTNSVVCDTASATTFGCLTNADWLKFNNKQDALGFSPLSQSSNLSDVANAATARGNLGVPALSLLTTAGDIPYFNGSAWVRLGASAGWLKWTGSTFTYGTLTKDDVGLSNVDNTADSAKPVSTATQTALNLKAPLANPAFTGAVATDAEYNNGTCTTSATISPANGNRQKITLTNAQTCALTFTQPSSGTVSIRLKVIQSAAGSFNGTISATGVKWPGGSTPTITTTTGAVDLIVCDLDGTSTWCVASQDMR